MMSGYILSIVGIVIAGVFLDIVLPFGSLNKYIKAVYAVFIIAVILSPVMSFINKDTKLSIDYDQYSVDEKLLNSIFTMQCHTQENNIENLLQNEGFSNVDIILNFSIENNQLTYKSCEINLKNLVISQDKQHINKYEFIRKIVIENTSLAHEEIIFHG